MLRAALAGLGHVNRLLERVIYALAALIVASWCWHLPSAR